MNKPENEQQKPPGIKEASGITKKAVIVRYGEVWLKSDVTRKRMIQRLIENISSSFKDRYGRKPNLKTIRGRILIYEDIKDVESILRRTFGVVSFSPAIVVGSSMQEIEEASLYLASGFSGTFKVSVNRAYKKFPLNSMELAKRIGSLVRRVIPEVRGVPLEVDLEKPKNVLSIDVRKEGVFLYSETFPGPGGLPYGSQGKALVLFSGGIDSPVAGWLIAKRGCAVDFLFVNMYGDALHSRVKRVFDSLKPWLPESIAYTVRIPDLRDSLVSIKEGYRQVVYKRIIYKIGEELAKRVGAKALVTGESLGQVSSQTLDNLVVIQEGMHIPVLRPLLGFDKEETIALAKKIGTFEESNKVPEFCKLEEHSNTRAELGIVLEEENKIFGKGFDPKEIANSAFKMERIDIPNLEYDPSMGKDIEEFDIVKMWEGEPIYKRGKRYILICRTGMQAEERSLQLYRRGIEAYFLPYRKALRFGLI